MKKSLHHNHSTLQAECPPPKQASHLPNFLITQPQPVLNFLFPNSLLRERKRQFECIPHRGVIQHPSEPLFRHYPLPTTTHQMVTPLQTIANWCVLTYYRRGGPSDLLSSSAVPNFGFT
ncbi:hypothetical protein CEXT_714601 [Caerostris extrusa]|uniref:Uncharacterized protein n=1 Tax=Caerostris extrusa TaxID=172846 RepID=A0AAV4PQU5_CAEEX|nr:hypothetical protein CEXT_714601 [Caerostris extrusa]